jgi:hypothetical protein
MFTTDGSILETHLQTSSTIKSQTAIIAEWNLNYVTNIDELGNYFYDPQVGGLITTFTKETSQTVSPKYYGGTDSSTQVNGGYNQDGTIANVFVTPNKKESLLFSLEDCIGRFRPRSGINKIRFVSNRDIFTHHAYGEMATRPRYYVASKDDKFKYWTSYRKNGEVESGISTTTSPYYIKDTSPFITYKTPVPANRIVVKMQTNVGTTDVGNVRKKDGTLIADPLYGTSNKTTPKAWKIQTLQGTTWTDAKTFTTDIVPTDGYVELSYGITNIPVAYKDNFIYAGEYPNIQALPPKSIKGYAYLVKTGTDVGQYVVWNGTGYDLPFTPTYGWYQSTDGLSPTSTTVTDLVNPSSYINGTTQYREFQYIKGIRIVVDTMNRSRSMFDLVEMSPRLVADLSDITLSYNATKTLSDLGNSAIPVGQLLASQGSLTLFDDEQAFNTNNTNSIIKDFSSINLQIKLYEIISQVQEYDYYVPIKTYYAEGFPQFDTETRQVNISLRDLYFYFESMTAPQLLIRDVSLSFAISTLLDSIGFSNYSFIRNNNETEEPIIPNFIIKPNTTVAQVLNDLAISTQSAMFFDEYNNFIVMSRNRMMPTAAEYLALTGKEQDTTLYGSLDASKDTVIRNKPNGTAMSNILSVASVTNDIFNDGKISYTNRYIQRSYGTLAEAGVLNKDKKWAYKPVPLWEISGDPNVRSSNREFGDQSSFALGAIPLNATLTNVLPYVDSNGIIQNATIDLNETVYWLPRYKGYFYSNGEIIKYDAVQYSVDGVGSEIWISDVQEYEDYFQQLAFNGRIFPTGKVRIFTEPYYNVDGTVKVGDVAKHGRAQFGTIVTSHNAGLDDYWKTSSNLYGCFMESQYLFNTNTSKIYNTTSSAVSSTSGAVVVKDIAFTNVDIVKTDISNLNIDGVTMVLDATKSGKQYKSAVDTGVAVINSDSVARKSSISGTIKSTSAYLAEVPYASQQNSDTPMQVQSSALVFSGPNFTYSDALDFVSYLYKEPGNAHNHFGTRMRILGSLNNTEKTTTATSQTPIGSSVMFNVTQKSSDQSPIVSGSSGGIGIMVNPTNNTGYFLEIVALTDQSSTTVTGTKPLANVYFYKNLAVKTKLDGATAGADTDKTIPVELYSGLTSILVDDGAFTGQQRVKAETTPSVYDISIEYQEILNGLRFYISINNNLITVVEDTEPLPITNSLALFVRGSSRCMFENVFALKQKIEYGKSKALPVATTSPFELNNIETKYEQYSINRVVQNTFLSQVQPSSTPQYEIYYDEFGSIMRECAYFNVKYDKAYPALLAKIAPTFNTYKGYAVSGFTANPYSAEFLIFNTTDTVLNLDESSGNYLRILGVTYTQDSTSDLTVDDYFNKKSDYSNPKIAGTNLSPATAKQTYIDLINSRTVYGKKDFALETIYIQDTHTAYKLMDWMINRIMKPRRSVGLQIFAMPIIQLGDIITIEYVDKNSITQVASSRFIVYSIEYSKDGSGPSMTVYLSEVV